MLKTGCLLLLLLLSLIVIPLPVRACDSCNPLCQTEPPCCANIIKKYHELGDITDLPDSEQPYHECPGLYSGQNERGYCLPSTCNQLPVGLAYRGRCGWYWSFHDPETKCGYGCMVGPDEANMKPICGGGGPAPTSPPRPTLKPTLSPTRIPIQPTEIPEPTNPLAAPTHLYPTEEPYPTDQPTAQQYYQQTNTANYSFSEQSFNQGTSNWNYNPRPISSGISLNLPSIRLPALQLQGLMINMEKVNQQSSKTLDFFEYVFFRVKFFDMKLERGINRSFLQLLSH